MSASTRAIRRNLRRPGLTVVEVIVALMLVSIGLLAIAGSTALALRTTLDSARRRDAAQRTTSRHAQLAATGCSAAAGTATDAAHSLTEQWTVSSRVNGMATITDSVRWMSARGPISFVLTSAITC
jgi:Tfp pilus assembly protein PilV